MTGDAIAIALTQRHASAVVAITGVTAEEETTEAVPLLSTTGPIAGAYAAKSAAEPFLAVLIGTKAIASTG